MTCTFKYQFLILLQYSRGAQTEYRYLPADTSDNILTGRTVIQAWRGRQNRARRSKGVLGSDCDSVGLETRLRP
jgi:hypothetical protein